MKTIEALVGEVAKNLATVKSAPTAQTVKTVTVSNANKNKAVLETTVTESKCQENMTLSIAKETAKAVELAARIMGVKVVIAVCNEGANLVLLHAMDDSYIASVRAAQDKAYTAVALKMPTHTALAESRGGTLDGLTNGNGILLLGGGYPLTKAGKIYGGIGVSGGTKEQDTMLAMVAEQYFRARF